MNNKLTNCELAESTYSTHQMILQKNKSPPPKTGYKSFYNYLQMLKKEELFIHN